MITQTKAIPLDLMRTREIDISERTACPPDDWRERAVRIDVPGDDDTVCVCPDANDIALSKLCAWRDKDLEWLAAGLTIGLLDQASMRARAGTISNPNAPDIIERARRLDSLTALIRKP